jgi:hypothetical protein
LAAVIGEEADQRVHRRVVGAIDDEAAFLPALRQTGAGQAGEVKRQRRRRQLELFADRTRRHSRRAGLHQQAEDGKPGFLREGRKGLKSLRRFHISRIVEMMAKVKAPPYLRTGSSMSTAKAATPSPEVKASAAVPKRVSRRSNKNGALAENSRAGAIRIPWRSP